MRAILLVLGMLLPTLGMAQVYKCVVNGTTHYQDAPCAGVPSRPVDTTSSSGVTGLKRDADRMAVQERQAASAAQNEAAQAAAAKRKAMFDEMRNFNKEWSRATLRSKK
jgi:hypothetical protein